MEGTAPQREHRKRKAGPKADKKKSKKLKHGDMTPEQRNPKAFSYHSVNKVAKVVRRTLDIKEKKHHIPVVDRTPIEPPPIVVAIVGPPKVGKTTLIQSLVKNYTRQKLHTVKGPVTIISGKKKRITLMECNNDINSMIDLAKIADLGAKLFYLSGIVNGEYQKTEIHNLGRFISVMKFRPLQWRTTHPYILADRLEDVTDPDTVRLHPKNDRTVCLYGYVRGTHLKGHSHVAIPGCGDFPISDISLLKDPCPLPDMEKRRSLNEKERVIYSPFSGVGGIVFDKDAVYIDLGGSHSMKEDGEKGFKPGNMFVSSIMETQTTVDQKIENSTLKVFTDTPDIQSGNTSINDNELLLNAHALQRDFHSMNDYDYCSESSSGNEDENYGGKKESLNKNKPLEKEMQKHESSDESDDDSMAKIIDKLVAKSDNSSDESSDDFKEGHAKLEENDIHVYSSHIEGANSLRWKENVSARAHKSFLGRQGDTTNLNKIVYGEKDKGKSQDNLKPIDDEFGGLFRLAKFETSVKLKNEVIDGIDSSCFTKEITRDWTSHEVMQSVMDCFVTGNWETEKDAESLLQQDDEIFGDFEDLETGEMHSRINEDESISDEESQGELQDEQETNSIEDSQTRKEKRAAKLKEKREAKKKRLKALFDAEYDEEGDKTGTYFDEWKSEMEQQAKMNRQVFEGIDTETRTKYEGFGPGLYVRIQINNIPCELVENFDPAYPVILGGLLNAEQNIGYVHVRIKKHRWHKHILKTRDPVIISLGWRRFQTIALFSIQDHNGRHRLLKYTPEHLHCEATFWGPVTPQNTGMLTVQNLSTNSSDFRITSTGSVIELDKSFTIVKKLKLTGTPCKIYRKTAFIQGMFNSNLEVAKFEGSSIRTVSGIRGQVKRAVKDGANGSFRATFEDKIILSDIVFLRTWYPVQTPKFYNPVTTLLEGAEQRKQWQGMKTVGQSRREKGLKRIVHEDHRFKSVERRDKDFKPLLIPKELQQNLPFKDKPKVEYKKKDLVQSKRVAVVKDAKERQVTQLMKMLKVVHEDKLKSRRKEMRERAREHQKQQTKSKVLRDQKHKELKKKVFKMQGKMEKNRQKKT